MTWCVSLDGVRSLTDPNLKPGKRKSDRKSPGSQVNQCSAYPEESPYEMNLPIAVFEVMSEMAKEKNIRGTRWPRAAGLSPSRLSGCKRPAKQTKAGAAEPG